MQSTYEGKIGAMILEEMRNYKKRAEPLIAGDGPHALYNFFDNPLFFEALQNLDTR
jgi:hypothetical protein